MPARLPLDCDKAIEECFQLHRQVYTQLGAMTNLRKLILIDSRKRNGMLINEGREPYYTGRCRQDRQAFTLDSGRDLLHNLKRLRTLDLSNMLAGFKRAPEQQWIRNNWPMMEQLNLTNVKWYED